MNVGFVQCKGADDCDDLVVIRGFRSGYDEGSKALWQSNDNCIGLEVNELHQGGGSDARCLGSHRLKESPMDYEEAVVLAIPLHDSRCNGCHPTHVTQEMERVMMRIRMRRRRKRRRSN